MHSNDNFTVFRSWLLLRIHKTDSAIGTCLKFRKKAFSFCLRSVLTSRCLLRLLPMPLKNGKTFNKRFFNWISFLRSWSKRIQSCLILIFAGYENFPQNNKKNAHFKIRTHFGHFILIFSAFVKNWTFCFSYLLWLRAYICVSSCSFMALVLFLKVLKLEKNQ